MIPLKPKTVGLSVLFVIVSTHHAVAEQDDDAVIRDLVVAQSMGIDPGGATTVVDSKVDSLLRRLSPTAYSKAARELITPQEENYYYNTISLVNRWIVSNPQEAFVFLSTKSPRLLTGNIADKLFEEWAHRDVEGALAAARRVFPEGNRPELVAIVLRVMAVVDPRGAMGEVDKNDSRYTNLRDDILVYWVFVNAAEAVDWALAQGHHHQLVWDAAFAWTSFDQSGVRKWAETLNDEDSTMAWTGILTREASSSRQRAGDPAKAAHEFTEHFPKPALNQESYSNQAVKHLANTIVREWSSQVEGQQDVMTWILTLPDVPNRTELAREILLKWASINVSAVSEFTDGLPQGAVKDNGRHILVGLLATKDPLNAFDMAKTITDEKLQKSARGTLFFHWQREGPDQAQESMSKLTQEEQDEVIETVNQIKARSVRRRQDRW